MESDIEDLIEEIISDKNETIKNLYFIEGAGRIKIGIAINPMERLKTLQGCSPVPLKLLLYIFRGVETEERLHNFFQYYRSHHEWFWINEPLKNLIERLKELLVLKPRV